MKIDQHLQAHLPTGALSHLPYRPDIDGLRAVAVLSVLLFHAFPGILGGGFIGVDVFFVISGFLISSILLQDLENGSFSFRAFYARRIKRIFPPLLLVMASCLVLGWFTLFPDELTMLSRHVMGGALFASNFQFWSEVGYFDTAAETKPLLHLWSLGIEEQFYIVWPVLLLAGWRLRSRLLMLTLALALLSYLVNLGGLRMHATATFYSPASRAWELLLGAALAVLAQRRGEALPLTRFARPDVLSLAGLVLIVAGLTMFTRDSHFPGWRALLPSVGALMIIGAGPGAWLNRDVLSNRVLVAIGLISYPLYLWHWPLLSFVHIIESTPPPATMRAAALALSAVLATLTYLLLERPLRRAGMQRKVALLCTLMAALALSALAIYKSHGATQRPAMLEHAANQKALILVEDTANAAACKKRYGFSSTYEYCLLAQVDKEPTVALVGDSHAYHIVAGLTRYYQSRGDNLLMLGTRLPYWNVKVAEGDHYQAATQAMLERALNTPSIKTVIFSTALRFQRGSAEGRDVVDAAADTLRRFTQSGKQVIFIDDTPVMGFDPRSCIPRPGIAASTTRSPCAITRAEFIARQGEHPAVVAELMHAYPQVRLFRTEPHLCDAQFCYGMLNGRLMYRDTNHLSYDGDLYIGAKFAEWADRR